MSKRILAILLIIALYSIIYSLLAVFPVATFFIPSLAHYFDLSAYIFVAFYLLILASYFFERLARFEPQTADWLKLHFAFTVLQSSFVGFLIATFAIIWSVSAASANTNTRLFIFLWFLSFMVGVFPYFHRVKNTLGMGFEKIEGASLKGASAYAELAKNKLDEKEKRGLHYLVISLTMLKENMTRNRSQINGLNESLSTVSIILNYGKTIPFNQLNFLAEELSHLPNMENISEGFTNFLQFEGIKWAKAFVETPQRKGLDRMAFLMERYMIPIAVVIVSLVGVLPEDVRKQIVEGFKQAEWFQILGFLLFAFLCYQLVSFFSRIAELKSRDIGLLTKAQVSKAPEKH